MHTTPGHQDTESNVKSDLRDIIGASSREWLNALCECFLSSGNYTEINDVLSVVEGLYSHVQKLASKHWGPGVIEAPESALSKSIRTIIKMLEDLLLNAMEGNDVRRLASRGLLLFQVAPDVRLVGD
ncbi:hypothetical protein J3R83DRAFT_139 [Lanmaoa asiatica]|nr:hypothetical protein J3R83DRAFT_139 [Lanmaoa asiatica]